MKAAEAFDAVQQLDEVGCRIMLLNLAMDNPALFGQFLDRVPIVNGGRWDRSAFDAREAAANGAPA